MTTINAGVMERPMGCSAERASHSDSEKSPLRYPGGKSRAVQIITKLIPEGTKQLVSPFLGGASVELYCAAVLGIQVYGADAYKPLVAFWKQALKNTSVLADKVQQYHPLEKETFYHMQKKLPKIKKQLELATAFFVLNRSSFSGTTMSGGMSPSHARFNDRAIDRLRDFRASNLKVSLADYRETINKHPDKFLYLDPPYAIQGDSLYGDKGDMHKGFDHEELADILKTRTGWILSYNNSEEIAKLYEGYEIREPEWTYGMSSDKRSREALIVSL